MSSLYESLYLLTNANIHSSLTSSITLETQLADSSQIFSNSFSTIDPLYEVLSTSTSYNTSYPLISDSKYEDEFGYLDVQIADYQKKYPHLTIDEIFMQIGDIDASTSCESARTGQVVDVTKLSPKEIIFLANSVDDINKFEALEHIRSTYVSSAPNVKLYYPEPFIASASFIHNDIGFIHILQYQFWLWFLFIFLIVFYFISFLCVVRWCSNRTQPRRETRGVSRSKCGDLITATVPVTWAVSIIVSESTDATDYYDGFGTGELIIGVRAYQWGWHYYYPKNADLNYNVSPNFSSFVGNSLKYTTTTSGVFNTRSLWKFYQTKADDAVVVPAHLLVLPTDNSKILNLMSFKNVGIDTIQASRAFKQIRANSRIYTTNLVTTPSYFTTKYNKINNLYFNESDLVNTNNFGIKHQYNLTSAAANTAVNSTFLDRNSLDKFLTYNLQYNLPRTGTSLYNNAVDLFAKTNNSPVTTSSINQTNLLLEETSKYNSQTLKLLMTYPNVIKTLGDNSDNKPTNYPLRQLLKKKFTQDNTTKLLHKVGLTNTLNVKDSTSSVDNYGNYTFKNPSKSSKEFMINYSYRSQPFSKQSVRKYKNLNANTTNYNLSMGLNSLDSNLNKSTLNNNYQSVYNSYQLKKANWSDLTVFNKLASNRVMYTSISPILTNNPHLGRLNYDQTYTFKPKSYVNLEKSIQKWAATSSTSSTNFDKLIKDNAGRNLEIQEWNKKKTGGSQLLAGDRSGEDRSSTASYWRMYWAGTNPDLRLTNLLHGSRVRDEFYLPNFVNYYDYDFRNAQALRLFEDVVWESAYSSYNHQDYLNIFNKYRETYDPRALRWSLNNTLFFNLDRDFNQPMRFKTNAKVKDNSGIGGFYTNSIQTDDYYLPVYFTPKKSLANIPFTNDSLMMDESYADQKNLLNFYVSKNSTPLSTYTQFNYPQSHHSVLNNFRADFEDFSHFQDLSTVFKKDFSSSSQENLFKRNLTYTKFNKISTPEHGTAFGSKEGSLDVNPLQNNWSRFSNPIALRRSAKSSMVTYQAYQKVFKLRYDEGRAHVRLTDFAASASTQPYTTEQRIKYDRMLGKTKIKHFNTTYNVNKVMPIFNNIAGLSNSLNYYFFEFPFLEGVTNDPSRHVWFDGYIKFAQREVGASSVSKFSIVGVPFYKKKYDFNVKQGKQMVDSELYFTRIATARKNYLPQWIHTPYLYTRSNEWFVEARTKHLYQNQANDFSNVKLNLKRMEWYWTRPFFDKTTSMKYTPSFSNNHKSTFRPYAGIQSYYYTLNTLTDLLSKREYLYRQTLEKRNKIVELPRVLRVTPRNPLLAEVKSSFLLTDPITYNAEYSREFYYNSLSYFQFILFKEFIENLNTRVSALPINIKLVNDYMFFYFFDTNQDSNIGARTMFRKNQYKPLKKGITSMMRLQGSGAVAMPIEIRLQILASSKDVIHSWAIPSAGIKIDCIPGYTSHRIMIFFTPGIYWGQCMEICGRYHHWMPIIVYFMKRDLFFLWCTHFLSKKDPYALKFWEANDKQYSDYINFISYNKSNWLTEISHLI